MVSVYIAIWYKLNFACSGYDETKLVTFPLWHFLCKFLRKRFWVILQNSSAKQIVMILALVDSSHFLQSKYIQIMVWKPLLSTILILITWEGMKGTIEIAG